MKQEKTSDKHSLLPSIQKVYSEVVLSILLRRMRTYHKSCTTDHWHKLKKPLKDSLDIASQLSRKRPPNNLKSISVKVKKYSPANRPDTHDPVVNSKHINELSQYFKKQDGNANIASGIDEKLKHSAWQHIHLTLYLARNKQTVTAQMHADIAYYACKELAHYLPEQEYCDFINEIQDELQQINNLAKQPNHTDF